MNRQLDEFQHQDGQHLGQLQQERRHQLCVQVLQQEQMLLGFLGLEILQLRSQGREQLELQQLVQIRNQLVQELSLIHI